MIADLVVVGLGNPGSRYLKTRHNAGFMFLDLLSREMGKDFQNKTSFEAQLCEGTFADQKLLLLKPQTFMNLSGRSLVKLYAKNKDLKNVPLLVVHDESDLPLGRLRVKKGGGDAGHNGLKSLRECLGHGDSIRFRLGVGRPPHSDYELGDYLLSSFSSDEEVLLMDMLGHTLNVFEIFLREGLSKAQERAGGKV